MNARHLIILATTSVLISAGFASAQNLVDRSGATDANRKLGSNGHNSVSNTPNPWDISNAIVYGNVTGGKQFRGNVNTTDPLAFRGGTGSQVQDNFIRDSSAVSTNGIATFNASQTKSYYGDNRAVAPPTGYVSTIGSGGYTPPTPQNWNTFDPRVQSLSGSLNTQPLNTGLSVPGIADFAQGSGGLVTGSSLQQRPLTSAALSDYTNLNQNNLSSTLTPDQLTRLRQEIGQDNAQDNTPMPADQLPGNQQPGAANGAQNGNGNNGTSSAIGDTRLNDQIQSTNLNSARLDSDAVSNALPSQSGQDPGLVTRLAGVPDTKTTDQTATDQSQPQRPGDAAAAAADRFNAQVRAKKAADDKAKNAGQNGANTNTPGTNGGPISPNNAKPGEQPAAMNMKVAPQSVGTLAGSTKAKGLSDLLTKAESQMRDGKFASAIDTYDAAESVDPRNPMIKLGRANAELGGAYYRRAEATLRQLPPNDRHVLAGRYDLRAFIGDDRLQLAQKDLSDLVEKSPNDTGAAVLLAYIYYNTGNERRTAALLDLADKRASGKDALVQFLKTSWVSSDQTK